MAKGLTEQQKKIVLLAIAAASVVYFDFRYVLKLQLHTLKSISGKLHQANVSLGQYNKNSTYYKNLQAEFDRLKNKHSSIEKYVFSQGDLPLLLDDISKNALTFGVKIMQIKPQDSSPGKEEKKGKDTDADFYPLVIALELTAGYHQLGKFLSALEASPLLEVSEVSINSESQEPAKQKAALTLTIYVQKK